MPITQGVGTPYKSLHREAPPEIQASGINAWGLWLTLWWAGTLKEAFQGVEVTDDMAPKTGDNPLKKH